MGFNKEGKWLVVGGAGFIGCNTVKRLLKMGCDVVVIDNLSRQGSEVNLKRLVHQGEFSFEKVDIRNVTAVEKVFKNYPDIGVVIHLAAQLLHQ
jgi:CDP-paratose 2-epimerase